MKLLTLSAIDGRKNLIDVEAINFSFSEIALGKIIEIPTRQQMTTVEKFTLEGELVVEGQFILDDFANSEAAPENNFSFTRVDSDSALLIPENQQMFLIPQPYFDLQGELRVEGSMILDDFEVTEIPVILLPDDNFSHFNILPSIEKTIPVNQQMIVDGILTIEGQLNIEGELSVISDEIEDNLPPYHVITGEKFKINTRKQLNLQGMYLLDGYLEIEGEFMLGA